MSYVPFSCNSILFLLLKSSDVDIIKNTESLQNMAQGISSRDLSTITSKTV